MNQEQTNKDVLEMFTFIRDHAATREDIELLNQKIDDVSDKLSLKIDELDIKIDRVKDGLEQKIDSVKNEMLEHVDGFIGLHKDQESEQAALAVSHHRLEQKVEKIAVHVGFSAV
jgi:uncharacterized protein YeeX (DUF496 family)